MSKIEIIGTPISNYVRSIRMLCEEKGVPYELDPAFPHTPEATALHPAGQVPCLLDGDVKLFESIAIAHYIDRKFEGPKFFPEDLLQAVQVEQWVSYVNVKVDRWIMREFVVPSLFFDEATGPDTAKINAAVPEIEKYIAPLDQVLADTGYFVGGKLTFADMNLLPILAAMTLFPPTNDLLSKFGNLSAFVTKLSERPSFKDTAPPTD